MSSCKNTRCMHYDPQYLYTCRIGDLFCLMVQKANRSDSNGQEMEPFFPRPMKGLEGAMEEGANPPP